MFNEYEYDYHDMADNADFIEEADTNDEYYYDDGTDEPWCGYDDEDNATMDDCGWKNYYHNLADEIDDD